MTISGTSPGHGRGASGPSLSVTPSVSSVSLLPGSSCVPPSFPGYPRVTRAAMCLCPPLPPGNLIPPGSPCSSRPLCPLCVLRAPPRVCVPHRAHVPVTPKSPCPCPRCPCPLCPSGRAARVRSPPAPRAALGCRRCPSGIVGVFPLPSHARVSGPAPRVPRGWAVSEGGTCPRRLKIAPGGGAGAQQGRRSGSSRRVRGEGLREERGYAGRGGTGSGRESAGQGSPGRKTGGQQGRPRRGFIGALQWELEGREKTGRAGRGTWKGRDGTRVVGRGHGGRKGHRVLTWGIGGQGKWDRRAGLGLGRLQENGKGPGCALGVLGWGMGEPGWDNWVPKVGMPGLKEGTGTGTGAGLAGLGSYRGHRQAHSVIEGHSSDSPVPLQQ